MGPVNGYQVRRELVSWRLEDTANVKPGSIYSAIRTLAKDGLIDGEPNYVITAEGEKEFQILLRESWWTVRSPSEPLIPALTLFPFMDRDELVRALGARVSALKAELEAMAFQRGQIKDGATGADGEIPEHVREIVDFLGARRKAELEWTIKLQKRIKAGVYRFEADWKDSQA
jgi:DNA-binding PadR family transcriptional regulator